MANLSLEQDINIETIGEVVNSLLSAVLSSVESNRRTASSIRATSMFLGMTSASSSASLKRDTSSVVRSTSMISSSSKSSVSRVSSTGLSPATRSSTSLSSSSSSISTVFPLASNSTSRSASVSALPGGASKPPAHLTTTKILTIVLSIVAGGIFLLFLLFVLLRRRRRNRLQNNPHEDSETDSAGRKDTPEKSERYHGSMKDEPAVRLRRFSSLSKRLWQDPPKRPLTPSWGPLPMFPDSASMMTVVLNEQQFSPRSGNVSRDVLGEGDSGNGQARPWNLQRGYSDPMLTRPTGRAIEISTFDIYRTPVSEISGDGETDPEEEEESETGDENAAQEERAEEAKLKTKSVEDPSMCSASSSMLRHHSRSLRAPHQSTSEFYDPPSSSYPLVNETKSFSNSHPALSPKPLKSLSRPGPDLGTQMSGTADSWQKSNFTLDGPNLFTD